MTSLDDALYNNTTDRLYHIMHVHKWANVMFFTKVSIQKAIRVLAALCALGLLGGVTISVWFIGKTLFTLFFLNIDGYLVNVNDSNTAIYLILFVYFCIVKLLLKPTSHSPIGLEDTKETSFCNISDDSSVTDPRKGRFKCHKAHYAAYHTR